MATPKSTGFNPMDYLPDFSSLFSYGKAPVVSSPASKITAGNTRSAWNPTQVNKRSGFGFAPGADPALGGNGEMLTNLAGYGAPTGVPGAGGGGWGDYFSMDSMFGSTNNNTGISTNGWVGGAMQGAQAIGDMYSSMKQFGLAEDQFDESKRQYNQNYQAQVKNYNADIEDRQRARVASNSSGYQSVDDYMAKNRQV